MDTTLDRSVSLYQNWRGLRLDWVLNYAKESLIEFFEFIIFPCFGRIFQENI